MKCTNSLKKNYAIYPLIASIVFIIFGFTTYLKYVHPKIVDANPAYTLWKGTLYSQFYGKGLIIGLSILIVLLIFTICFSHNKSDSFVLFLLNLVVSVYFLYVISTYLGTMLMFPVFDVYESGQMLTRMRTRERLQEYEQLKKAIDSCGNVCGNCLDQQLIE